MEAGNVLGQLPKPGEPGGAEAGRRTGVVRVPVARGSRAKPGRDIVIPSESCSVSASLRNGERGQESANLEEALPQHHCPWLPLGMGSSHLLRSSGFKRPDFEQIGEGPEPCRAPTDPAPPLCCSP